MDNTMVHLRNGDIHVSKLYFGQVVIVYDYDDNDDVGHIVGFDRNELDELLLRIKRSRDEEVRSVHPIHVSIPKPGYRVIKN